MQQQNDQSPIWAIDLFERRQFRNGSTEAQCLECGQRYQTIELTAMTGHIVQKHPRYAAKLLAKQLELGGHQLTKQEEDVAAPSMLSSLPAPTISTNRCNNNNNGMFFGERTAFSSSSNSAPGPKKAIRNSVDVVSAQTSQNADETWNTMTSASFASSDVDFALISPPASVVTTAEEGISSTTAAMTTKTTAPQNGISYVDRFGKEWLLLVSAVGTQQHLGQIARQHLLYPKGPAKHDGRIYFSCRWSGRWSSAQQCPHRALYLPERQALFFRQAHNHPTTLPTVNINSTPPQNSYCIINNNKNAENDYATIPTKSRSQIRQLQNNNDDTILAFSAALPDIDNETADIDCKNQITAAEMISYNTNNHNKKGNGTASIDRPPHFDSVGKKWHWLFDLDNIGQDKGERVRQFCKEHFLTKCKVYARRVAFMCKINSRRKSKAFSGIARCHYRAMFVQERRAMFAYESHNHPPLEEAGNEVAVGTGIGHLQQQQQDGTTAISMRKDCCQSVPLSVAQNDDYVDSNGNVWKWLANIDVGECEHNVERQQLSTFCSQNGLHRNGMRRKADGTLRIYGLSCKKQKKRCLYRAIYVVERRAVFDRYSHNHLSGTVGAVRRKPPKKKLANKKSGAKRGAQKAAKCSANSQTTAKKNECVRFTDLSLSNVVKLPPVITDVCDKQWHWLTNLADASNDTVMHFCSQFYVNRMGTTLDGTRVKYWCRYRRAPIKCPYKMVHLRVQNALYHRMAHNHPMPLGTELMELYRSQRRAEKHLWRFKKINLTNEHTNAIIKRIKRAEATTTTIGRQQRQC